MERKPAAKARLSSLRLRAEARMKLRHLYDEHGRADARAIAKQLGWSVPILANAFGLNVEVLRKNPVSEEFQDIGLRTGRLLEGLLYYFGDLEHLMIWMRRKHPDLRDTKHGKQSPLNIIKRGHLEVIEGVLHALDTGQPG